MSKIVCDDCLEYMKKMKDNSVDLVLTDPPYGLKFMGKEWDVLPSVDIWKEALRVLKTGDISPYTRQSEQSFALAKTKVTCHHTGDSGSFSRYFSLDAWWERMFSDPVEVPCPECNGLGVIEASPIKETFKEWIAKTRDLGGTREEFRMLKHPVSQICHQCNGAGKVIQYRSRIKDLPEAVQKTFPFLITPKPSKREKSAGVQPQYRLIDDVPPKILEEIKEALNVSR